MIREKQQSFATCFSPRKRVTGKQILREAPTFSIASAMARVPISVYGFLLELGVAVPVAVPHLFRFYMFHLQTIGRIENAAEQGSNPPVKPSVLLGLEETNKNRINNVGANLNRR